MKEHVPRNPSKRVEFSNVETTDLEFQDYGSSASAEHQIHESVESTAFKVSGVRTRFETMAETFRCPGADDDEYVV